MWFIHLITFMTRSARIMKKRLMRKRFLIAVIAVMMLALSACSKDDVKDVTEAVGEKENPVAEEVVNLVMNEIPAIAADRNSSIKVFNDYFKEGKNADSEEWLPKLKDAKETFSKYITKLDAIGTTTDEGAELMQHYRNSAYLQLAAMDDIVNGIENYDTSLFDSASTRLSDSKAEMGEYERKLAEIAKANNINLSGSFIYVDYNTATDAE